MTLLPHTREICHLLEILFIIRVLQIGSLDSLSSEIGKGDSTHQNVHKNLGRLVRHRVQCVLA